MPAERCHQRDADKDASDQSDPGPVNSLTDKGIPYGAKVGCLPRVEQFHDVVERRAGCASRSAAQKW